ncbi:MAG: hypothetical protein GYB58_09840 [Gammaproteobacteria bacterium]|nr:hypothetical protein [Gammaproteobacteria bacterium]
MSIRITKLKNNNILQVFLLVLSVVISADPLAQETSTDEASTQQTTLQNNEIITILDQINTLETELEELEKQVTDANGDDYTALQLIRKEKFAKLIARFQELERLGKQLIEDGADLNTVLSEYRDYLLSIGAWFRQEINNSEQSLLVRDLDTTTEEGVRSYLLISLQLDEALLTLSSYIGVIRNLSFEPKPSVDFLAIAVPERAAYLAGRLKLYEDRIAQHEHMLKADEQDAEHKKGLLLTQDLLDGDANSM